MSAYYRWSDNDRRLGRFIYAREKTYRPLAVEITSNGDEDDEQFSTLRLRAFGHTLIVILPPIVKPWKRWVDTSAAPWSSNPAGGYWDMGKREYGFSVTEGYLSVSLGRVTNDSSTEQRWGYFLPWTQWRFVGHRLYGIDGTLFAKLHNRAKWRTPESDENERLQEVCPRALFEFDDYDGERITATTKIEEREWAFGERWCKFLSLFRRNKVRRSLDLWFSAETGKRKGSWKGGTLGHSIDMLPGELHEAAFRRYCAAHGMTFVGATPATSA
ncbi:hypothetical protein [Sphingomonas sp. R86520]|uniref:hypothetical protein n=1 Tax=Sphingomonas sp. R86520 TaxID=3093859 RepID=UPI0036D317E0